MSHVARVVSRGSIGVRPDTTLRHSLLSRPTLSIRQDPHVSNRGLKEAGKERYRLF